MNMGITSLRGSATSILMVTFALVISLLAERAANGLMLANTNEARQKALHQLLEVFEMDPRGRRQRHSSPPQYMLDLYNSIADSSGVTRSLSSHPYEADIVRSFTDRDMSHHNHFFFNLTSGIPAKEQLLEAEFHIYKIKPHSRQIALRSTRSHLLELRLYQIMSAETGHREEGNRLLDTRRVSLDSSGWEVFYVKSAVLDWLRDHRSNYGLLLSVKDMLGLPVDGTILRFDKRHHRHANKQPILVLFTSVDKSRHRLQNVFLGGRDYGHPELSPHGEASSGAQTTTTDQWSRNATDDNTVRMKRSVPEEEDNTGEEEPEDPEEEGMMAEQVGCSRQEMYVDFEKLGWSSWIISPKGYHAYHCRGSCSFPLGQNQWPTNHATLQSIVHELNLTPGVGLPCCVPNKLYPINLLYFVEQDNVILRQFEDMVVVSCGCH